MEKIKILTKKHLFLFILLLAMTSGISSQAASSATASACSLPKHGWFQSQRGNKFYFVKGKRVTGWKKISGYWYYFNEKGRMVKNRIVPAKKGTGYRFVGSDGIYVNDPVVQRAVNIVSSVTKSSQTRREKLKTTYDYLKNHTTYRWISSGFDAARLSSYAEYYLNNLAGECITTNSGFSYIGLVLGFHTRLAHHSGHTWPEIATGKLWYIYDLSRENNSVFSHVSSWYKVESSFNYSYSYTASRYSITTKKGKVIWSKIS